MKMSELDWRLLERALRAADRYNNFSPERRPEETLEETLKRMRREALQAMRDVAAMKGFDLLVEAVAKQAATCESPPDDEAEAFEKAVRSFIREDGVEPFLKMWDEFVSGKPWSPRD